MEVIIHRTVAGGGHPADGRECVQRMTGRGVANNIMPLEGMPFLAAIVPRWEFSRTIGEHFDIAGMIYCRQRDAYERHNRTRQVPDSTEGCRRRR